MTLLRNVFTDLVDKKLWPVAAVLLIALVALPLFLASGGESTAPPSTTPATQGEPSTIVVTPAEQRRGKGADRPANDPFRRRPAGPTASAAPSAVTAPTPSASAADPAAQAVAGASAGASAPAAVPAGSTTLADIGVVPVDDSTPDPSADRPAPSDTDTDKASTNVNSWSVDLRFGKAGSATERKDVARLTAFPSPAEPYFVFLGVAADGETALFLVTSDATASGDGTCSPSTTTCERVALRAGQTEAFDVATPDGQIVKYQLDLVEVARVESALPQQATALRARESAAGRQVLRTAVETKQVDVSDLAYAADLGLVVPSGRAASGGGTLFGGYRVDLRFGAPGALVKRYNLARLTPLPSVDSPSFLFLGVVGDGRTAMFLNPSEAATRGEGVCEPSPEECPRGTLQSGQSVAFDTPAIDGSTTEYQLAVDAITPVQVATAEEAAASRRRESPAGRIILRRLITEVGGLVQDLTFSSGKGVVEPAAPAAAPPGAQPAIGG